MKKLQIATGTYSPYNINVFNELFYKYAKSELINELPNLFSQLDLFNIALHKKITSELNSNVIKVMELVSGKKMDRWETFIGIDRVRKWRVLLTDFDKTQVTPSRCNSFAPTDFQNSANTFQALSHTSKFASGYN